MSVHLLSVTEVLTGLVNAPSVNPSLAPSEGTGEAAVAEFACGWFNAHGVSAWKEDAAPGRPNVVAEIDGADGPRVVLCAHLDTVGTAGMTIPPFEARVEGDRLYGRGAYDNSQLRHARRRFAFNELLKCLNLRKWHVFVDPVDDRAHRGHERHSSATWFRLMKLRLSVAR